MPVARPVSVLMKASQEGAGVVVYTFAGPDVGKREPIGRWYFPEPDMADRVLDLFGTVATVSDSRPGKGRP